MAAQKSNNFTGEECALADFAAALAHPARIAIIKLLQECGEAPCGRIVEALPLSQATVSQHLHCLYKAGLLKQRQCGKRSCYSIDCERVRSFCHNFQCTLGTAGEEPEIKYEPCCPGEVAC
ncbi:MAG TPA: metalloregulator ArsR/SmtB family transcription factor [Opitutales bacterium]|nr:metalloregulator ArsR/SmtB family transcription factor [Opitutales bacterium]